MQIKLPFVHVKEKTPLERISVGLDFGSTSVKYVKIRSSQEGLELCDWAIDSRVLDVDSIAKRIQQPPVAKSVTVSVSGPSAIIRYLRFPRMTQEELQRALKFEAQKYIPFPLDELFIDSYILKEDLPDNKMFILLSAVKKELVTQRMKMLQGTGLEINAINMDSLALINAFTESQKPEEIENKTTALLHIGASETNLNILDTMIPRLSRNIPIAGNVLTGKIADAFSLEFREAEQLKVAPAQDKMGSLEGIADGVLNNLVHEISASFDYWESQGSSSVNRVVLSGGGACGYGIKEKLNHLLGVSVDYWDPFQRIAVGAGVDKEKIQDAVPQLCIAAGLAMRI